MGYLIKLEVYFLSVINIILKNAILNRFLMGLFGLLLILFLPDSHNCIQPCTPCWAIPKDIYSSNRIISNWKLFGRNKRIWARFLNPENDIS